MVNSKSQKSEIFRLSLCSNGELGILFDSLHSFCFFFHGFEGFLDFCLPTRFKSVHYSEEDKSPEYPSGRACTGVEINPWNLEAIDKKFGAYNNNQEISCTFKVRELLQ